MPDNDQLSSNQRRALAAILGNVGIPAAAAACGLSEKTLYRFMGDPTFRAALLAAEGDLIDETTRRLVAGQQKALDALEGLIDQAKKEADKRLAAVAWLDFVLRWRELNSIEKRLADLEAAIYAKDQH